MEAQEFKARIFTPASFYKHLKIFVASFSDFRKARKNGNVSNLSTTINAVNSIASSGLLDGTMSKLMNKAVSSKYVSENALDATLSKTSYKIKNFKIYKDKKSGEKIVHAIAKGNGKTVAILLEFAEKAGEISK